MGNTDVSFNPPSAYCSDYTNWGYVEYTGAGDGIMYIRSKSYDPSPHETGDRGSHTQIKVWVKDSAGDTILESSWKSSDMWFEGELECQKAQTDYMPGTFEKAKLWTSNGNWVNMWDVIDAFSEGFGFVYFAGHSSPLSWGDHYPGIPGGRRNGQIGGISTINFQFGLERYAQKEGDPLFLSLIHI